MARADDLIQGIRESLALLHDYEGLLRLAPDPKEQARCRREIAAHGFRYFWPCVRTGYVRLAHRLCVICQLDK